MLSISTAAFVLALVARHTKHYTQCIIHNALDTMFFSRYIRAEY